MAKKRTTNNQPKWEEALARFEEGKTRRRVFVLSSPGVAQVTRVRLLSAFDTAVEMTTERNRLIWQKPAAV